MPVVNTKARTITTKIVFMTFALCLGKVSMAEPDRRSVTGITAHGFLPEAALQRARPGFEVPLFANVLFYSVGARGLGQSQNSLSGEPSRMPASPLLVQSCASSDSTPQRRSCWDLFETCVK
jgi:hypothetical protein